MNKTVNHCGNCPFYQSVYDEYSIHNSNTYTCGLAYFLKYENYFIDDDENSAIDSPDWCPLKKEETFNLKFKNLSFNRVTKISECLMKIESLDIQLDNMSDDVDGDEYAVKWKEMTELCEQLEDLKSEE